MSKLKSDVVVIGAGPAGSTTARVIAEHGFDVILVEKDEYPGKTNVCAGGIPKQIVEETGLSSDIVEKEILRGKFYYPWGVREQKLNHAATVYRNVFDKCLAEKAEEEGAKMITNTLIRDVKVINDKVYAISDENIIESEIVVFADGPNTLAYRKFGIGFKPEADKTCVSVACEVKWENNPLSCFEYYYGYDISPFGYGWIFPKRDTINVGVGCLYSELRSNLIYSLNYILKKHLLTSEKIKGKEIVWLRSALIPVAPAKRIFGERMLVVGDAAGMVDPVFGGGIKQAIEGGKIAGEVCVKALWEMSFSSKFLSQYQDMWHKTRDYLDIYRTYLLSNAFLYLSKHDRNAYPRMAAFINGGIRDVFNTLRFIYMSRWRR